MSSWRGCRKRRGSGARVANNRNAPPEAAGGAFRFSALLAAAEHEDEAALAVEAARPPGRLRALVLGARVADVVADRAGEAPVGADVHDRADPAGETDAGHVLGFERRIGAVVELGLAAPVLESRTEVEHRAIADVHHTVAADPHVEGRLLVGEVGRAHRGGVAGLVLLVEESDARRD